MNQSMTTTKKCLICNGEQHNPAKDADRFIKIEKDICNRCKGLLNLCISQVKNNSPLQIIETEYIAEFDWKI